MKKLVKSNALWMVALAGLVISAAGCSSSSLVIAKPLGYAPPVGTDPGHAGAGTPLTPSEHNEIVAFSAGDFLDAEARFRAVPGVVATAVGYEGGSTDNPTYDSVISDSTGHALVVLVEYNPRKVDFEDLLETFFRIHNPTTLYYQRDLHGKFVRSAIFYHTLQQRNEAATMIRMLSDQTNRRIYTFVAPEKPFWKAEDRYQQYHEKFSSLPAAEPVWR